MRNQNQRPKAVEKKRQPRDMPRPQDHAIPVGMLPNRWRSADGKEIGISEMSSTRVYHCALMLWNNSVPLRFATHTNFKARDLSRHDYLQDDMIRWLYMVRLTLELATRIRELTTSQRAALELILCHMKDPGCNEWACQYDTEESFSAALMALEAENVHTNHRSAEP